MVYGLSQYYNDELTDWYRVLTFHKAESRALVSKIAVVLEQQAISSVHEKESSSFIDQFMVQQQEFDHISNQITSQQQRLERTVSFPVKSVEFPISTTQDTLRARMQSLERNFIRLKYTCSLFLSSFLND
jgi:hypothetical protein